MPISIWCLLIAAILPLIAVYPAKISRDFDNSFPRNPEYWRDGFRARALAAQNNGFEAFPLFAVAVIVALSYGGDPHWIDRLAMLFVTLRIIYTGCYWTDRATPRSIAWTAAFLTAVAIFVSPIWS